MRSIVFAKRNMLEYLRTPIMLFFTLAFPVLMFFVFKLIIWGTGATEDMVPMFAINNIIPSIAVFSFSFIALTLSTQIAKDRGESFQSRLSVSPMKPIDFFLGYFIPSIIIALCQILLCTIIGICFGLKVGIGTLYMILSLILISMFYISTGILIGSLFNEKTCGGISSIIVNVTAVFSGMFFPLTEGTFKTVLSLFPFLPSVSIPQGLLVGNYNNMLLYFVVLLCYMAIIVTTSIIIFGRKIKKK